MATAERRPRLMILSFSPLRRDPRVLRQIRHFAPLADVTTVGYGPSPDDRVRHLEIPEDTIAWPSDKVGLILHRHRRTYDAMTSIRAAREVFSRLGPDERPDAILADDINALPVALELEPPQGVHADLHEFAPLENEGDLKWRTFVGPFMDHLCRTHLPRAASVTTVSPGIAERYRRDYGITAEVVTNAAPRADYAPVPTASPITVLYTGVASRRRRLEDLIDGMREMDPAHARLTMALVATEGQGYIDELRARAEGSAAIDFRDPVPYAQLLDRVHEYDLSIAYTPPTSFNNLHALPNKFFEAIQARVGLVVGPNPDMAAILREHGLGVVLPDFTGDALHEALSALAPGDVDAFKANADRAADALSAQNQTLIWDRAIRRLIPLAPLPDQP